MRAVDLYVLTRSVNENVMALYEKCISSRESEIKIRSEEIEMIRDISNALLRLNMSWPCFEKWFYSFTIPQISKEFDLLKIGRNKVAINIELKGQEVDIEKIKKQLIQNRHYLMNGSETVYCFTCMRAHDGSIQVYELFGQEVENSSFEKLKSKIELIEEAVESDIESLFRPKDYLVSPINSPDRFLAGRYFLNDHQEEIKNRVITGLSEDKYIWGIKGGAGTGKTLLLYDIVKTLAVQYRICIIHAGLLSEGHKMLASRFENVSIIDAKSIEKETMCSFDIICVDEAHRLYTSTLDDILELLVSRGIMGCIFSYDYNQCLSRAERRRNNPERLKSIVGFSEEKLTERIRTNKEIFSFIRSMLRLKDTSRKPMNYDCIDIVYANTMQEADKLLDIYLRKDYKFITLTPSQYYSNEIDHFARYDNSHQVIGQEFDNVVIIIDNNFRYSSDGELEGKVHPNPNYLFPKLFYQNITRAREKLCVIVLNNPSMFETLLRIKDNSL